MIVYIDTGFFIDFFSQRSLVAVNLRTNSRRSRSINEIQRDSLVVMKKLKRHDSITSTITVLEYKDNTYDELKKVFSGLFDINIENLMKTKSEASVLCVRCRRSKIRFIPLDSKILEKALTGIEYNELEINDTIHVETARSSGASIILSTDSDLLKFDKVFDNIRIVDSNDALALL